MLRLLLAAGLIFTGPGLSAEPSLRLTSRLVLDNTAGWFGGFSGAEIAPDGSAVTLITDKGTLVTARLIRKGDALTSVVFDTPKPLKRTNGRPLRGIAGDAEGLAISDAGKAFVSFEQNARVTHLDLATGITRTLPRHPDFAAFESNKGPEALAIHPNGTLFTLPERSATKRAAFPLYAFIDGQWRVTHKIPRRGQFLVAGADFDRQGRLYMLERSVSVLGFRSRIRRFDLDPANLTEETLLTTLPGQYDNLEAISLWYDDLGQTRLFVISDDNFLSIQQTEITELTLHE